MEAFVIAKGHLRLESHFSKEHHRSKLHDLNSKSDQKSIESIDQPNGKSTNKLQDVKSIVCTNGIKLPKTVHEDVTRKFQCEPEQIAKKAKSVQKSVCRHHYNLWN